MLNRYNSMLLILVGALIVRLIGLSQRDLYCDEAVVMLYSKMSWERLLQILPHENYGPLWFIIQKLWNCADGYVWARLLSVAIGVALVAMTFEIGMGIGGPRLALIAGLITATNCYLVSFSQKVWSYMPCTAFVTLALLAAWRLIQLYGAGKGSEQNDAGASECNRKFGLAHWLIPTYCIASLLALYTHYIALPPLFAIAITCALYLRHTRRLLVQWLVANLLIVLMVLPWAKFMLQRASSIAHGFHMSKVSLIGILDMLHDFSLFAPSVHHAVIHARTVVVAGALLFSYLLFRGAWVNVTRQMEGFVWWVFIIGIATWAVIASFLPIWHPRTLLPLAPSYCLIISQAMASQRRGITIALLSLTVMLNIASLWFYFTDDAYAEAQWKAAAGYLIEHRRNEPVVHSSVLSFAPIAYHMGSTIGHKVFGLTEKNATAATNFVLLIEPDASLAGAEELGELAGKFWLVETTDWRPWIEWRGDEAIARLHKCAIIELMLKLRGVSIYRCEFKRDSE